MGLLEKFKNAFFEEEYVEIEEKPKIEKRQVAVPKKVERPAEIDDEPVIDFKKEMEAMSRVKSAEVEEIKPESVTYKEEKDEPQVREPKFNYFDDDDFVEPETNYSLESAKSVYQDKKENSKPYGNTSYNNKSGLNRVSSAPKEQTAYQAPVKEQKSTTFKPTPIISPIYGILDKNYTKDDIADKKEVKPTSSYVSRKNADLDSVRRKAFGNMELDFGLTGEDDRVEEDNKSDNVFEEEDNLLYDMTDIDKTPSVDKVTLQDAEEYYNDLGLEYNVDYKDAKMERKTGRRVSKTPELEKIEETEDKEINNVEEEGEEFVHNEDETVENEIDIEESDIPNNESYDDDKMEDNLFDLIDSMYDEKE